MTAPVVCCTCATVLNAKPPKYSNTRGTSTSSDTKHTADEKSETSPPEYDYPTAHTPAVSRQLPCCNRIVCSKCTTKNPRFETYCPFCQISTTASSLPQGLRDPPPYDSKPASPRPSDQREDIAAQGDPPTYSSLVSASSASTSRQPETQEQQQRQDVIHHIRSDDNMQSLSLAYGVPAAILRSHNNLFSDSLLPARRTIAIPTSHYNGPSLSAESPDSPEEAARKAALRRFMLATKCSDYSVAELYLTQARGDAEVAVEAWRDDERWERENPLHNGSMSRLGANRRQGQGARDANGRSRRQAGGSGSGLTGQLG